MNHRALLAVATSGSQAKTYVEDVFSAYPYTGNGSSQTITDNIDRTKGSLDWFKQRNSSIDNIFIDTQRGASSYLQSDSTSAEAASAGYTASPLSNGVTIGSGLGMNGSGISLIKWTFRRAPKFFDVVTWTGDGTSNRQIPHALAIAPGMVTAKRRDAAGDWAVWHRSATGDLYLDLTNAQTGSFTQITAASATTFSVSGNANILNATYVAYAWAHDPDTVNGIVQCGSFTTDASGNATVNLGWEPQYFMLKSVQSAAAYDGWNIFDSSRGFSFGYTEQLFANSSGSSGTFGNNTVPTAQGFSSSGTLDTNNKYIYLAIRRGPMRTPTTGTSVYNAISRTPNGSAVSVTGAGFAPDFLLAKVRTGTSIGFVIDRLRGRSQVLGTSNTNSEPAASTSTQDVTSFDPNGASFGTAVNTGLNNNAVPEIDWFFARAPGFFDIVCYKGTGANQTLAHNLGVAPGMMWVKGRDSTNPWIVYTSVVGSGQYLQLNTTDTPLNVSPVWNNTNPTSSTFTVGVPTGYNYVNGNGLIYVAYLFASCPGVSKIGSYTGNGATQTINCGFTSGARFVLIKRTDAAGDWIVLDTVRGIIVGNNPYLTLDTTAGEVVTTDLTPQSVGFGLTSNALVNANGGNFIYFAIA